MLFTTLFKYTKILAVDQGFQKFHFNQYLFWKFLHIVFIIHYSCYSLSYASLIH